MLRRAFAEFYSRRRAWIYTIFASPAPCLRNAVLAWRAIDTEYEIMPLVRLAATLAVAFAASAVADDAATPAAFDGSWSAAAPIGQPPTGAAPSSSDAGAAPHRGGGRGGMGGGQGGHGGMGGHGGHHAGGGAQTARVAGTSDAEQNDPGLRRVFAEHLTITKLTHPDRMRFDDGTHPVELSLDGMNISGPGVGGTVALTATSPELVVDSVTTSGYTVKERYTLADDGTHLELHASLKKPDASDAREITRVFDRGAPKPPATPAQ